MNEKVSKSHTLTSWVKVDGQTIAYPEQSDRDEPCRQETLFIQAEGAESTGDTQKNRQPVKLPKCLKNMVELNGVEPSTS